MKNGDEKKKVFSSLNCGRVLFFVFFFIFFFLRLPPLPVRCSSSDKVRWGSSGKRKKTEGETSEGRSERL